ncbi:hypothetical protein F4777DRAFT_548173 [Nemania sp. FL0916]|nr:hypothetical protein F4777DRAFT_548173 [Nemania sp. FL0916]
MSSSSPSSRTVAPGHVVQVLNQTYDEEHSFPQFNLLPWEIRNNIWTCALQVRRLIRARLWEDHPMGLTEEEAAKMRYGRPYLLVRKHKLLSKLLSVNSEARRAALLFYRVRLPCLFMELDWSDHCKDITPGVFPFNPEWDILWFDRTYHLTDFISALVDHDRRRVGLCNIAVSITEVGFALEASDPSTYQRPEFVQAVKNIREFYLVAGMEPFELQAVRDSHNNLAWDSALPITQKLNPYMSKVPAFDLLPRDPRAIERDLVRLFLGSSNIPLGIHQWKSTMKDWGVDPEKVLSRVIFMLHDYNPTFPSAQSFHDGPCRERLRMSPADRELFETPSADTPSTHQAMGKRILGTGNSLAFGFWLFPLTAFPCEGTPTHETFARVWNMLDSWPELGLSHVPVFPRFYDEQRPRAMWHLDPDLRYS